MAVDIKATFHDYQVQRFLSNVKERLKNVENGQNKFVGLMSAIVFKDVMDHFKNEEGSKGPWKSWSNSYKKYLNKIGRSGNKILQFDGTLRQSFKPTNAKFSNKGLVWFNNAKTQSGFPYAFAHNEGGRILPQRDFMWLSDEALEKVSVQTLQFMIDEGI